MSHFTRHRRGSSGNCIPTNFKHPQLLPLLWLLAFILSQPIWNRSASLIIKSAPSCDARGFTYTNTTAGRAVGGVCRIQQGLTFDLTGQTNLALQNKAKLAWIMNSSQGRLFLPWVILRNPMLFHVGVSAVSQNNFLYTQLNHSSLPLFASQTS